MNTQKALQEKKNRLHRKIRSKISGTAERPRLSVFRSLRGMNLQLIDDVLGKTLASVNTREVKTKGTKTEISREAGKMIAEKAKSLGVTMVVFDRGANRYHGRVQAVADALRESGIVC
ncbi:MAG: 50S ribosomal protein L18 [Candidatus Falkowbacteria bacterium]|nr:50S ribosomal protein L18 [Candidatus Falkowbacteria bacterium]